MTKVKETEVGKLLQDNKNFNKGTQYGDHLMEESISRFGLGRSILIDKHDRIIAGNKTAQKAGELGIEKVLVVETTGDTIVAVKRVDVDLDTRAGRELALADNATGKANLSWDVDVLNEVAQAYDFAPEDWGVRLEEVATDPEDKGEESPFQRMVFELSDNQAEMVRSAIDTILELYPEECKEIDGNTNKEGNALAKLVELWSEP